MVKWRLLRRYRSLMPSCAGFLEPRKSKLGPSKSTFNAEILYAACFCTSLLILAQFTFEMCLAAQNRQKIQKTSILEFKVIQGHWIRWQSRASVRLPIIVINSNLGPISHRYWDTSTASYWLKISNFAHPPHLAPLFGWHLSNLWGSFTVLKTSLPGSRW